MEIELYKHHRLPLRKKLFLNIRYSSVHDDDNYIKTTQNEMKLMSNENNVYS